LILYLSKTGVYGLDYHSLESVDLIKRAEVPEKSGNKAENKTKRLIIISQL